VSGYLVDSAAFKAVGTSDPRSAGSIPVHLRQQVHCGFCGLVLGVEDGTKRVVGSPNPLVDDEKLLVVDVQLSLLRPHAARLGRRESTVYVRLGSTNREADDQLIAQLRCEAEGVSFDEMPLGHLTAGDVDLVAVRRAISGRR
jgi:predicted HTH transcriptional regulator